MTKRATSARKVACKKRGVAEGVCSECGRAAIPAPMNADEAAIHRENLRASIGGLRGDRLAYQWARSTVLLAEGGPPPCKCDRRNWNAAFNEYDERGAEACWASLGVTADHMKRAEAERLSRLQAERPLTTEETARLAELATWMASS
jgi:hypothetical protein